MLLLFLKVEHLPVLASNCITSDRVEGFPIGEVLIFEEGVILEMRVGEGSIRVVVLGLDVWHLQVDIEGAIGFFGPKRQVGLDCMGGEVDLGD